MNTRVPRFVSTSAATLSLSLSLSVPPACAAPVAPTNPVPAPRAENPYLSQVDAAARAARVANVEVDLALTLSGKATFAGTSTLRFDLKDASSPLTIDLDKATIVSLRVNGKEVAPRYNGWFLTLPADALARGRNTVTVAYERPHSTNGEGLHRMVDPVDGRVYTYSHFEPAAAHQMFATFDQPDLKATYRLSVTAPADWQVISTTRETAVEALNGAKRWTFAPTKKLSPYNFSMHAGPYKMWEDKTGAYPMRLFARQSVAGQIHPEDWFRYTKAGLAFFDDWFGIPYQFGKYDQILVPDFLYGAMENAGAITFAEHGFMTKGPMTPEQRARLAGVIMHEMAHQWFGDLVTMRWWNGLWLNESFASFMGTLATAEATEFKDAWRAFNLQGKGAAYAADQKTSTHPIEVPVPSTANAFDNIDAITYSKGASTLMQLRHLLGQDAFRKGVHDYLVNYQYRNAQLDDFVGSLASAAGRDLNGWTRDWLYQPGVNTIAADYACKNGKIASFALRQEAPADYPTLREQRVQVATFRLDGAGRPAPDKQVAVTYKGASTPVPGLVGAACPDLVYPNAGDWGYVKVRLDARSFATTRGALAKVDDPLLRGMLWQSLWDGVRDATLPLDAYFDTALANAPREQDYTLLGDVLGKLAAARRYLSLMGDAEAGRARDVTERLERMAWNGVQANAANAANGANAANADFQRRWFDAYVSFASSRPALDRLAALLDGRDKVAGLDLNQDLRWAIVVRLNRFDYPGAQALLEAERARDTSDSGQAAALAATVARPDPAVKAEWLAKIGDLKTTLPFSRVRVAMVNLYPAEQEGIAARTAAQRLAGLERLDREAGPVYMRAYAPALIPAGCSVESSARLQDAADRATGLSTGTRRALLDAVQEDRRCTAIRAAMHAR